MFSSVHFREILPTEIFLRYIPTELPWENNIKQSKKKDGMSFLLTELPMELPTENSVGKFPR
jgi:hypothetical protein